MQLALIFPPATIIQLPPTMPQMHINLVRHKIMNGELKLLSDKLDIGYRKFRNLQTGETMVIEVTKQLNL